VTLREIFSDILANLAFMFTDDDLPEVEVDEVWFETTIRYEGPTQGRLRLYCAQSFMTTLAGNLLGVDPDDSEADIKSVDAVKELMNILCGQLVTQFYGADAVFNLSIPECNQLDTAPDIAQIDTDEAFTLAVNGSRVRLTHTQLAGGGGNG
jgi:chemotaxis protein CheY-P-specific phosphatase CheC